MRPYLRSIPIAAVVLFSAAGGCGPRHEMSGPEMESPPVAPMTGRGDHAGATGGSSGAGGSAQSRESGSRQTRGAAWPFRPTSVRLHPLTHALRGEGRVSVVEARLEFFDRFGHTTKALGLVRFELRAGEGEGGPRLAAWEIDVRDIEENMAHYDDVTRTYLFRLGLEEIDDLPGTGHLAVTAVMPDGHLKASLNIALR